MGAEPLEPLTSSQSEATMEALSTGVLRFIRCHISEKQLIVLYLIVVYSKLSIILEKNFN
jgi:hypothetical protein